MNNRARYPPGIGLGRGGGGGGGLNSNPGFQPRPPHHQQYVQRQHMMQQQQHQQQYHQQYQQHQQQQQQQWLRRTQLGGSTDTNVVEEVEKTVQSEAVDPRYVFFFFPFGSVCFLLRDLPTWIS